MSIGPFAGVAHAPAGSAARLSDPVAVWGGNMNAIGDATGGIVEMTLHALPDHQRRFVYVIDWLSLLTDTTIDPGEAFARIDHHHELPNVTLDMARFTTLTTRQSRTNRIVETHFLGPWLRAFPIWWRRDLDSATDIQRSIIIAGFLTNNNLQVYQLRAGGRVYDARIIGSRDWWTLWPAEGKNPGFPE